MAVRGEHRHVDPEFGDAVLRAPRVDSRDAPKALGLRRIGGHERSDQGIQLGDGPVQVLHVGQLLSEERALHRGEAPREGGHELGLLLPEPPLGQAGQGRRVRLAVDQRGRRARPETPKMSEATEPSLRLPPSRSFWRRFVSSARRRISCFR